MTTAIGPGAGMPTEWSACVDQLAFGLNGLDPYTQGISWGTDFALKQRLFVMSAGNVPWQGWTQYPDINHSTSIEDPGQSRSEEHTSELQSPCNLVCRLLLEKKNKTQY